MSLKLLFIIPLLACATPAKRVTGPQFCTIPLTMVLTTEGAANDLCYTFYTPVSDNSKEPLNIKEDAVMGCAGLRSRVLIAEYQKDTVMHETRHFVDKFCPWLKEIR